MLYRMLQIITFRILKGESNERDITSAIVTDITEQKKSKEPYTGRCCKGNRSAQIDHQQD